MESSPSRVSSPSRDESGEEELSVLPRHTKVTITGNNRTRNDLVGLQGVVTKAGGLGGWHWLALNNGDEVKLQRNALTVLEPPTGDEDDNVYDFDDSTSGSDTNHSTCRESVNLAKLGIESLRRYCQRFHLVDISSNPTKEQLIKAAQQHFLSQKVDKDEEQVIVEFSRAAKRFQLEKNEEMRD